MSRRETNPYFSRPPRPQIGDYQDYQPPPISTAPLQPPIPTAPRQFHGQPPIPGAAPIQEHVSHQPHLAQHDHFPSQQDHQQVPRREKRGKSPRGGSSKQQKDQGLRPGNSRVNFQEPTVQPPHDLSPEPRHQLPPHQLQPRQKRHQGAIRFPKEQKSKPLTWMGACLCVIFWLVIIIGGLIVLIVYLVFRPQIPHFDVSGFTLDAAYLDVGYLLNGDFTMLANFTNPNKKVHVDFSSVIIYLYYGSTLIATQYVEPFSAARVQSRFAYIHMVSSQVQLPLKEGQRLMKQMESNGVLLEVRGVFRARSKLGAILRYSYNLYGRCSVMVTRPPAGILLKKKCRTKR